ncbi:MAG: TlyA family RNA methyltransferase [Lawsonella sp.]
MVTRNRIDTELVRRKLAQDKKEAAEQISAGRVLCNGMPVKNIARIVNQSDSLVVKKDEQKWASRGAHKLLGAIQKFAPQGFSVENKRCLDAGASTGGFTDVLLHYGASEVVAVDVGYGQLIWRLQSDDRVTVMDRTNVRHIDADVIGGPVDVIVSDLSFISLTSVLDAFYKCCQPGTDLMLMVKPQFEVAKNHIGEGGVVREPQYRADAVFQVATAAQELGFAFKGVGASPLPGPSGNVEYFLWLTCPTESPNSLDREGAIIGGSEKNFVKLSDAIKKAVEEGPQ